jgi:hypothetical protein
MMTSSNSHCGGGTQLFVFQMAHALTSPLVNQLTLPMVSKVSGVCVCLGPAQVMLPFHRGRCVPGRIKATLPLTVSGRVLGSSSARI